ncbi:MAG: hypothetical protein RLZZ58_1963 [Pseudomonadota bacterium]
MTPPDLDEIRHGYAPESGSPADPPAAESLRAIAANLVAEIRTTISAEQELLSARLALFGNGAKRASIWGSVAASLIFFAAMALVFGAVLSLSVRVGPELATLITCAILLLLALGAAGAARTGARDAGAALKSETSPPPGPGNV